MFVYLSSISEIKPEIRQDMMKCNEMANVGSSNWECSQKGRKCDILENEGLGRKRSFWLLGKGHG